jgi:erythromycin esterase-like protein
MTADEGREAGIRKHVTQVQAMVPLEAERVQGHVTCLLRIIDDLRARLAAVEQERDDAISDSANDLGRAEAYKTAIATLTQERDVALAEVKALREVVQAARELIPFLHAPNSIPINNLKFTLAALDAKDKP